MVTKSAIVNLAIDFAFKGYFNCKEHQIHP